MNQELSVTRAFNVKGALPNQDMGLLNTHFAMVSKK